MVQANTKVGNGRGHASARPSVSGRGAERIPLRLPPTAKDLLEQAARLRGLSLANYIVACAVEAARRDATARLPESEYAPARVPVIYLAYLARDLQHRGQGYGDLLLVEALRRAEEASRLVGAAGVFLYSLTEAARLYVDYQSARKAPR